MKEIIARKLIIDIETDGSFKTGVIQYQVKENGVVSKNFNTVTIDNGITVGEAQGVIDDSISLAEQAEGIN
jgi:hypothetical protein